MRAVFCIALFAALVVGQTAQNLEQLFRSAVKAQRHGDYNTAIRNYRLLLKSHPDSVGVLANLGAALVHEKHFDQGVAEYREAMKFAPGNSAIEMNLALALYKKGDFGEAAKEFAMLAQAKPGNARLETLLGLSLIGGGKRREGATLLDRVAQRHNDAGAYLTAGSTWLNLDEFKKARRDLEAALRLDPNLPRIHTLVGLARDDLGDMAGAEPEFRKALAENPNDFRANLTLGAELYKQRHLPEARKYLEHATALQPSSAMARYELALVKRADGDLAAAATDLQEAIREKPGWLDPHVALAALYYKLHRPADGLKQRQIVQKLTAEQQERGPK
ncbi:MAG: tetratricopeptide repeat protein [Bryobacteraceae bacterium]